MNTSLFSGITVLELGHIIAGPYAASMLADFGATVIKVEQPGRGDTLRASGPTKDGQPLWWKAAARNKQSITIDLSQAAGQDLVRRLVAQVDVVIENFRPGALDGWGLGWTNLQEINPRLIMLRISGFGQDGPGSQKPGFGRVGEAMSGAVHLQGYKSDPPTHFGFSLGDMATGLMGAFAISGVLFRRSQDADDFAGECIDLALYETLFRWIDWQMILFDQLGFVPERDGNHLAVSIAPISNTYQTKDGRWITMASVFGATFFRILEMVGGESLRTDPRFQTREQQMANQEELDSLVRVWVSNRTLAEALSECEKAGAVAGPVMTPADIVQHPTYLHRQSLIRVPDPVLGEVLMHGVIPKLATYPGDVLTTGPGLGEHTDNVLRERLGLNSDEIALLREQQVL